MLGLRAACPLGGVGAYANGGHGTSHTLKPICMHAHIHQAHWYTLTPLVDLCRLVDQKGLLPPPLQPSNGQCDYWGEDQCCVYFTSHFVDATSKANGGLVSNPSPIAFSGTLATPI